MTVLEVCYSFIAAVLAGILQMLALLMVDATLNFSAFKWHCYVRCVKSWILYPVEIVCGVTPALMPCPLLTAFVCLFTHPIKTYTDDTSTC